MKSLLAFGFFIAFVFQLFGQAPKKIIQKNLFGIYGDTTYVEKFSKNMKAKNRFYFETDFGEFYIKNPSLIKKLEKGIIKEINIVFTQYPVDLDFSELIEQRIASLFCISPQTVKNRIIRWRYTVQTDCKTEMEARKLFHGFEIVIRDDKADYEEYLRNAEEYRKQYLKEFARQDSMLKIQLAKKIKIASNVVVVSDITGACMAI